MIQTCHAAIENAWSIMWPVSSIYWNTDWSWSESYKKGWATFDKIEVWDLKCTTIHFAYLGFSSVWVFSISGDTVILDISETIVVVSTVATIVSIFIWAVNQLLFRENDWFSIHQSEWFQRSDSTESPTWTTASLIFDWWNKIFLSPINFSTKLWHKDIRMLPFWIV